MTPIPQTWLDILKEVQAVFPDAIIAGGALRDNYLGRPVKDLDIMVSVPGLTFDDVIEMAMTIPGLTYIHATGGEYVAGWQSEVMGYIDFSHPAIPVQIIPVTTPVEEHLSRLDFGVCQIGHNGREVFTTEAFLRDVENQTFTLVRSDAPEQKKRSLRRYARLSEKYPGWKLVDNL